MNAGRKKRYNLAAASLREANCLSRRSAVVRGAVDTGFRRNNNSPAIPSSVSAFASMISGATGLSRRNRMRKLNLLFMAVVGVLMSAMPVFAQGGEPTVDHNVGLK